MNSLEYHKVFLVGVFAKLIHGVIEAVTGIFVIVTQPSLIHATALKVYSHELIEDPSDVIANIIISFLKNLAGHQYHFFGALLVMYGLVNVLITCSLLLGKKKYFVASIVIFVLTILYQISKLFAFHSKVLMVVTLVDMIIFWLVVKEYKSRFRK